MQDVCDMMMEAMNARHRCSSAEVHICEVLLVLVDGAPRSIVLLLLLFLGWLLAGLSRRFVHRSSDVQVLARVVSLRGGLAFVTTGHDR